MKKQEGVVKLDIPELALLIAALEKIREELFQIRTTMEEKLI